MMLTPAALRSAITRSSFPVSVQRQARCRLVHDDDAGVHRQRLGDLHHLALRDGQVLDQLIGREIHTEAPAATA